LYLAVPKQNTKGLQLDLQKETIPAENHFNGMVCTLQAGIGFHLIMAYDDLYAVQYFGQNLKPWWKRSATMTAEKMLEAAEADYRRLMQRCDAWDQKIYTDAVKAGGKSYASLCQLAYRQAIAAHSIVADPKGELLFSQRKIFQERTSERWM